MRRIINIIPTALDSARLKNSLWYDFPTNKPHPCEVVLDWGAGSLSIQRSEGLRTKSLVWPIGVLTPIAADSLLGNIAGDAQIALDSGGSALEAHARIATACKTRTEEHKPVRYVEAADWDDGRIIDSVYSYTTDGQLEDMSHYLEDNPRAPILNASYEEDDLITVLLDLKEYLFDCRNLAREKPDHEDC